MPTIDTRPLLFVISGPSGAGKSTAVQAIVDAQLASRLTTYTTRPRRPSETDGVEYHFIDADTFLHLRARGEIAEYRRLYSGHYYASPRAALVSDPAGALVIELDTIGFNRIKANSSRRVIGIFVTTPSPDDLRSRLSSREHASADLRMRMLDHMRQLPLALSYDHFLLNKSLPDFLAGLRSIVHSEILSSEGASWIVRQGLDSLLSLEEVRKEETGDG